MNMKSTWKFLSMMLLVAFVSAGVSVFVYSSLGNKKQGYTGHSVFDQSLAKLTNYSASAGENTDFTVAAQNSVNAVVHIKSVIKPASSSSSNAPQYFDPFEFFFGQGSRGRQYQYEPQPKVGFGSGVIISTDGYIMTNNHVIDGADEISVTMNDNSNYSAKLIGSDPVTDIALIKIDAKDLPVIPFGDSDQLKVGEWVLAVGNPFNLTSTVTAGIVSAKGRGNVFPSTGRDNTQMKVESFIQTDAAVNPGNSGGALVNTKGELVGINTAIYSQTGNFAGYSFAVPVSIASKVAADLKQYGAVQRAILGVTITNINDLKEYSPDEFAKVKVNEGAYVSGFSTKSAAKDAGIQEGDVIVAVNDIKVRSVSSLQEVISRYSPGTKVNVKVMRGNTEKTFNVELKNSQGSTEVVKNVSGTELLGAAFQDLTKEQKSEYGVSYGIEVSGLSDGKMRDAGIKKGFVIMTVNERKVTGVDEFKKYIDQLLKQNADDRGLFIKGFYPNGRVEYYAINLNN